MTINHSWVKLRIFQEHKVYIMPDNTHDIAISHNTLALGTRQFLLDIQQAKGRVLSQKL